MVGAVALGMVAAVLVVHWATGIPLGRLTRDPAATLGFSALTFGPFSGLAALLWTATAAVCLFCASLNSIPSAKRRCFAVWGGLTVLFALDDLFMFHDDAFPRFLGIPQTAVLLCYGALGLACTAATRRHLSPRRAPLFWAAITLFCTSVLLDLSADFRLIGKSAEDFAKLAGIVVWLGHFAGEGRRELARAHAVRMAVAPPIEERASSPVHPAPCREEDSWLTTPS